MLTDDEIEFAAKTKGVSWTGYREDAFGFYTIPILSPYHYQFARAIEAAVLAKMQAQSEPVALREFAEYIRRTGDTRLASMAIAALNHAYPALVQQEPVDIADGMAYAFHSALGDGSLTHDEVDEIKRGLAAAFANFSAPVQQEHIRTDNKQTLVNALNRIDELESQNKQLLEALKEVWLWMEDQYDGQSKGGHATFDMMMLREHRDIARAAIAAVEGK